MLPYAAFLLIGVTAHGVLRLCGSTQRARATVGVALFAGGGPANVLMLLLLPLLSLLKGAQLLDASGHAVVTFAQLSQLEPAQLAVVIATTAMGVATHLVFLWSLAFALVEAHPVRWRWVLLSLFVAVCVRVAVFELVGSFLAVGVS